ncbi:transcriptional regulator, AraC family [Chthoniobacter flavus Ellin428]|uniref:Transcriptional regulator, AraC family n=1 Tax=Chthoniobacter flavus Ellin428 TaxID=497964 RepID=B4D5Y6_9BACT|nr:AraC family transcriptional regulator [Chthoniobacter flavus]EDY18189.1 transcriptional regulator, AraC family [Chthoniobacter flavus Ellin428]TCO91458.1 AraC-like DNA-binding protein [Chthoniobacter flavus]
MNVQTHFPEKRPSFVSTQVAEARRYYLDLQPRATREITVVCGGVERVRPDYVVQRRTFPYYAVEFVAEGEGSLLLAGKRCRLRPGVVFAYGPRVPHTIRTEPGRPMLKYYVDFVGRRAKELLEDGPVRPGRLAQVSTPGEIREIFESLQRNGGGESPFGPALCAALIPVLLLKIAERAVPAGGADPRALATYQRARALIDARFLEFKTLDDAARAAGVNLSYLCRLFQRFDHQTPYRHLLHLKMNRAAQLLLDRGMLVKEAAAELGFSDPFNFSRAFRSVFGLAPEKFLARTQRRGE